MQNIKPFVAVRHIDILGVVACGITYYSVPYQRVSRTDGSCMLDGVHVLCGQNQAFHGITAVSVLTPMVINTGGGVTLARHIPCERLAGLYRTDGD